MEPKKERKPKHLYLLRCLDGGHFLLSLDDPPEFTPLLACTTLRDAKILQDHTLDEYGLETEIVKLF